MVVVGTHARVIRSAGAELGAAAAWRALCPAPTPPAAPAPPAAPEQSLAPAPQPEARPVPLLLKDPVALLMHFVLLAPEHPPYIEPAALPSQIEKAHKAVSGSPRFGTRSSSAIIEDQLSLRH
ncbi:unnamed protein product [Plutella xylostella]|uniref:(diamondback moth) hypothetical protein n=1 Tax=Plutella xylostella TaxID=51655 RepID=A0A8S4FEK2_PLUXY|nr:unnamed protein product [Plutella xylostella]